MLAKERGEVASLRRERVIERRGDQHFDDRLCRPAVEPGVEERPLHIGEARRDHDAAAVMLRRLAPGKRGEARQFTNRQIHAEGARTASISGDARAEVGGQDSWVEKPFEGELRMQVGDHSPSPERLALVRNDPYCAALLDQNLFDCAVCANVDVAYSAGARDCLRDRAHAAYRMAPDTLLAVHLAPAMMQQHIARAGSIGAVVGSNDSVETKDRLDRFAFEPLIKDIAGRTGEEFEKVTLSLEPERTQAVSDFGGLDEGAKPGGEPLPRGQIGRRFQRERAQDVG